MSYGQTYYQVSTTLELRGASYAEWILDQGFREWQDEFNLPGKRKLIRDPVDFSLPGSPVMLNGRGHPIWTAVDKLQAAITNTSNTLTLQGGLLGALKFPPGPTIVSGVYQPPHWNFFIKIDNEIMMVTQVAAGSFAITRGIGGTTAAAHALGAAITLEPYFMFYYPYPALPFSVLSLPAF